MDELTFDERLDRLEDRCREASVRLAWLLEQLELWCAEAARGEGR